MPRSARLLFATICGVSVATIYSAQPMLTLIGDDLGISSGRLGWIVTAGQLGYLAGLGLLVPLGDLRDRRTLIVGHLLLTAVGVAIAGIAPSAWIMLAGVAMAGLFSVVVQTTVAYAASAAAPHERGRTLGVVTSGVVIGILGARAVAGALAAAWGWRSVYAALAVLLVALAALVPALLPADPRTDQPSYRQALRASRALFGDRLFVSRGLIAFFLFASFGTLWSGLALTLTASPWHLSTAQIGLFGLAGLAGALGAGRTGRWADAGFADRVTGAALALLTASWLVIAQASWALWPLIIGLIVLDFAAQAVHVSNQHLLTAAHPNRASTVIGGYMLFYSVGSALGAVGTTAVYSVAGWIGSSALGAAFAMGALAVWIMARVSSSDGSSRPARQAPQTTTKGAGPSGPTPSDVSFERL